MIGASRGSALRMPTVPRLKGRSTSTWQEMPWLTWALRAWSSTNATTNTSCRSGTGTAGVERKKAPAVAMALVIMPLRWRRHSNMALTILPMPCGDAPKDAVLPGTVQLCT